VRSSSVEAFHQAWARCGTAEPERWRDPSRQRDVPLLVACYRLLAQVATGLDRPVHVSAWEHPWIRIVRPTERGRRRRARALPAPAALQSRQTDDERPLRLLLLPDVVTAPSAPHRAPRARGRRRGSRWLQEVARRTGDRPLRARVLDFDRSLANRRDKNRCRPGQVDEVFALARATRS